MSVASRTSRGELEELYFAYAHAADDDVERWPDLFTDDAIYKVVSRENDDLGLPLATMSCEGRGMLLDRVGSVQRTSVFVTRFMRHLIANVRIVADDGTEVHAEANYVVFESLPEGSSRLFSVGRYRDRIVREAGALKFKEKVCVFDGNLVLSSLIYPL